MVHIYIGTQRIVSKLGSSQMFAAHPKDATKATKTIAADTGLVDYTTKNNALKTALAARFVAVELPCTPADQNGAGLTTTTTAQISTPLKYYYHSDHLGSSSLITDSTGKLVQHLQYIPFGEIFVEQRATTWSSPYRFNGKEQDAETGLCYYGARYYDPKTSVWLSVDPLAEKMPNVSSYVYCLDNPVKHIDPDGRFPILINGRVGKDSERASSTYWNKTVRETIKAGTGYSHSQFMYVDGDKGRSSSTRINAGIAQGKADAASVYARLKGSVKNGQITEQLQAFSHSRGSAFGSGYMQGLSAGIVLLAEKDKIGFAYGKENIFQYSVNLAPHQSNSINYGNGTGCVNVNISHIGDPLSGNDATGNVINVQSIPENDAFDQHGNATYNTELNFVLKILENNTGNVNPTDQVKAGYLIYDKNRTNGDKSKVTQGSN